MLVYQRVTDFDWTHDEWSWSTTGPGSQDQQPMVFARDLSQFQRWMVQKETCSGIWMATLPSSREAILQNPLDQPINWFHSSAHNVFFLTVFWPWFPLLINKRCYVLRTLFLIDKTWIEQVPFSEIGPVAGAWYVVPSWCRSQTNKSAISMLESTNWARKIFGFEHVPFHHIKYPQISHLQPPNITSTTPKTWT